MLMRSGFFTRPRPLVEFDCGSQSTRSVLTSAAASEAARLMAVVVLPTPPFWLATAMTRPMILFLCVARQDMRTSLRNQCQILVQNTASVSRGTPSAFPPLGWPRSVLSLNAKCFTRNTSRLALGDESRRGKILVWEECFTWNTLHGCVS